MASLPAVRVPSGSRLAAELSELAATHGRFWDAHSLLLAGREGFTTEDLLSVGRTLELEPTEVESALRQRTYRERVLEDVAKGEGAGVSGTPSFFVDGEPLVGHWRQLAQVIPAALAERGR